MGPYERHVFICTSQSACAQDGPAHEIRLALKTAAKASGMSDRLRINQSGCLGQCGHGPMMVVYPEGTWYAHLDVDKAQRVWEEHLLGGRIVDDLRYEAPGPGGNKLPLIEGTRTPDASHPDHRVCNQCPVGP